METSGTAAYAGWDYRQGHVPFTLRYLWPVVSGMLPPPPGRVLDVGCGNGFHAGLMLAAGYSVVGVDLSEQGIDAARQSYPRGRFERLPADERLLANLGEAPFDVVVSTEVVEHLYDPRSFARGCFAAVRSGGHLVLSTPYHGYLKNLAISVAGKWDTHADPLFDGGHIKLWSWRTISRLLTEVGFTDLRFAGAGRFPYLWMSMVVSATRP